MNQSILNLILALSVNELVHNALEVMNMREKLRRLTAYMHKKPYKELPINIDTRAKSYGVSFIAFIVFVLPLWGVFTLIDLDQTLALKLVVALLIAAYFVTAVTVDQWHVDIEKITRPFIKKSK
ncbi:MAG: hypothetical protein QG628_597 [Patescibacteria group bacterium]|nr:hypothetical protein [Patescibacteria group bacterium]